MTVLPRPRRLGVVRRRVNQVASRGASTSKALGVTSLVLVGIFIVVALFAPLIAPMDPTAQSIVTRLKPPAWSDGGSWDHALGTDGLGRDVLSRLVFGARTSLAVGVGVVALAAVVGTILGIVAGYARGRADAVIMRVVEVVLALPGLLVALVLITFIGPGLKAIILVLAANLWPAFTVVARGATLTVSTRGYVEAAELIGSSPWRIVLRHVLPNIRGPLLTLAIMECAAMMLAEATLSFLGYGIQPPGISWGLDTALGREYIFTAWWLVTFPGLMLVLAIFGLNILGSWVRARLDRENIAGTTGASEA